MYSDQGQNVDGNPPLMKRVTRWIGVLSSIFVVLFIGYWAFHLGRRDASEVPVIAAMEGEARTAPENQESTQEDYQGLEVNEVLEGNTPTPDSNISLAPNPDDLSNIAPATSAENSASSEVEATNGDTSEITSLIEDEVLTSEEQAGEEIVSNTGITMDGPPRRPELLYVPSENAPAPQTTPAVEQASVEEVAPAQPEAVAVIAEPEPEPQPEPVAPAASSGEDLGPRLPTGTPLIQLAANTDPDTTRRQWAQLQADNQDILGDKALYIEKALVNGTNFYRLRVQGFANSEQTRAACAALMARNVQCLAVTNQ